MILHENGSAGDDGEYQRRIAAVNERAARAVEQAATLQRRELIDTAFSGMLVHVTSQQERMDKLVAEGRLGQAAFDRTVLQTITRLPFKDGKPQNAFSLLLTPDENLGQEQKGEEKMMLFIPVPEDFTLTPGFNPNLLQRPDYILVERYDVDGQVQSYIISDTKVEEFQSAYHEGEELTGEEAVDLFAHMSRRVNPMDAVVGEIMTDMTDWTAQVQRSDESE